MLKQIGYWKPTSEYMDVCKPRMSSEEIEYLCNLPFPIEQSGPEIYGGLKGILLEYLGLGIAITSSLGFSYCRLKCGVENSDMGCRDLTDGVWLWPEGLSHYVDRHNVQLPEEFIQYASSHDIPTEKELRDTGILKGSGPKSDISFWVQWAREHGM